MRKNTAALFLVCVTCNLLGCGVIQDQREIHTFGNLQALAAKLRQLTRIDAEVSRDDFDSVVMDYFENGKDPWGNPILFFPPSETGQKTFLLISLGSDGILDVDEPADYFNLSSGLEPAEKEGRDIVMKGYKAISYGAHK